MNWEGVERNVSGHTTLLIDERRAPTLAEASLLFLRSFCPITGSEPPRARNVRGILNPESTGAVNQSARSTPQPVESERIDALLKRGFAMRRLDFFASTFNAQRWISSP